MRLFLIVTGALLAVGIASAQRSLSPPRTATASIGGDTITINYSAPSVRGRKIFGEGGLVMQDPTAPIWRAGANSATSFSTAADLDVGGLTVPKGDYTLFVNVKDPNAWILIFNKQTGQWGLTYEPDKDLGSVKMEMRKPPSTVETLKYTITSDGGRRGTLQLEWENHIARVAISVK